MNVVVVIRGKTFPLCLTVAALDRINERCGGISGISDFLNGYPPAAGDAETEEMADALREAASRSYVNNAWMLGLLLQEGEANRRMEARFLGETGGARTVPGPEDVVHLLTPGEIAGYRVPVLQAVTQSMARKLEADPSKNGFQVGEG